VKEIRKICAEYETWKILEIAIKYLIVYQKITCAL
jgi:hypothetical protein